MSQFNAPVYDIERPTGRCALTDQALEPGVKFYAALIELTDEQIAALPQEQSASKLLGMKRVDICASAWESGNRPPRVFGYWKTTMPEPTQKRKLFVDDAILMNLLIRLADATEPQRLAFRYVLGLLLMRKKLLRYDGNQRRIAEQEGEQVEQEWWQYTPKLDVTKGHFGKWNEDERIDVLDPKLDDEHIELVTRQLGEILEAEL